MDKSISLIESFNRFLKAQEIEEGESSAPYYSRLKDPIFSVQDIWKFMHLVSVNEDFSGKWMGQTLLFKDFRDNSPIQQETLLRIITAFLSDENLDAISSTGKGQVWYLFANAVASYCSYNRYYWISKGAMQVLDERDIDTSDPVSRSKIFQIRNGGKKVLTFEHMCPATQLIKFLLIEKQNICKNHNKFSSSSFEFLFERKIKEILESYGLVAIITKEEDKNLCGYLKTELDTSLSYPLDQMLDRYEKAKIILEKTIIPVFGKMYR
jgi:hypothetical protein